MKAKDVVRVFKSDEDGRFHWRRETAGRELLQASNKSWKQRANAEINALNENPGTKIIYNDQVISEG